MSAIVVVTQPSVEPVTLDEAKLFCRIDGNTQNELVSGLITAAREYAEAFTKRAFITTTFRQSLDRFPGLFTNTMQFPRNNPMFEAIHAQKIKLYRPPLISVDHIEYKDASGVKQTLQPFNADNNPTGFMVDADNEPASVYPAPGTSWPISYLIVPNNVKVIFSAGYGDSADAVPEGIKTAIKQLVAHWFEHRESVGEAKVVEVPQAVDMLLTTHKIFDFSQTQG